jgi:Cu(I)/Ag(I) efflux system periplasmic protein CusF
MKGNRMKAIATFIGIAALAAAGWAAATGTVPPAKDPHAHHAGEKVDFAEAEVRKVDKDAGKITLKHGPIPSLDMPAMSMVFRAKDPAMLDQVKQGDKIRFKAEKVQGAYTVTEIQQAK